LRPFRDLCQAGGLGHGENEENGPRYVLWLDHESRVKAIRGRQRNDRFPLKRCKRNHGAYDPP